MIATLQVLLLMLLVIGAIAVVAARLKIPPSILLVLTGTALALVPHLPSVELAPELVLLVVLPPVIYSSAVAMSWREFRFNLRPITLLAVGSVLFTAMAIAAATHWLLGFAWPVGFALGAIVSPPDAVAPLSIVRGMHLPRRLSAILEGEGLVNDATALTLYRFALAAVSVGSFSLVHAVGTFVAIIACEIVWGILVGWLMLRLRRWVRDVRVEILLSLLTPFVAYWPPERFGASGVIATVATGLYISWNGLKLISAATRLQGIFFWDFLIYVVEGMVFLITGLQARRLIAGIGDYPLSELFLSAAVLSAVVIVARLLWVYPATYLPRWLIPSIARKDPSPSWQSPFLLSFAGIRGIVSLAAALSLPLETDDGAPFPHRNLILFLTFSVILVTLVGQGLALPAVVRWLGLAHVGRRERRAERREALDVRRRAIGAALDRLEGLASERGLPEDVVRSLRAQQRDRLERLAREEARDQEGPSTDPHDELGIELLEAERDLVNALYRDGKIKDESRRFAERDLDLRDARLRHLRSEE